MHTEESGKVFAGCIDIVDPSRAVSEEGFATSAPPEAIQRRWLGGPIRVACRDLKNFMVEWTHPGPNLWPSMRHCGILQDLMGLVESSV